MRAGGPGGRRAVALTGALDRREWEWCHIWGRVCDAAAVLGLLVLRLRLRLRLLLLLRLRLLLLLLERHKSDRHARARDAVAEAHDT